MTHGNSFMDKVEVGFGWVELGLSVEVYWMGFCGVLRSLGGQSTLLDGVL